MSEVREGESLNRAVPLLGCLHVMGDGSCIEAAVVSRMELIK